MNPKTILENFSIIANSPNGVQKLRELILQLAVQGKLVPQDPNDEPASELLKKIEAEKEKLIQEGKIKRQPPLPKISEEEQLYAIPTSWQWVRLGEIYRSNGQKKPDKMFSYIDVTAINKEIGAINNHEVKILSPEDAPSRARKILVKGNIIYSTVRPYLLNIAIIENNYTPEPIASTAFVIINPLSNINNKFIFYYLRSSIFIKYVESKMVGMAYPAINDEQFQNGYFPLPPLAEQKRIVSKVDELMSLCDTLEKQLADKAKISELFASAAVEI